MTRQRWKRHRIVAAVVAVGLGAPVAAAAAGQGTTDYGAGVPEPVLSELTGSDVRIPNSDPVADDGEQLNLVGEVESRDALGATSLTGHEITRVSDPHDDLADALDALEDAAAGADAVAAASAAAEIDAILQGTTEGRIYDGFDLLNRNRGAITADHVPGEYKTKRLRDSGETATSVDGVDHRIWEVDVNMLWYGSEFDADTFLLRVPVEADGNDLLRVNYRIYSLVREDFSPTSAMADFRAPGSVPFPYAGLDSVWQSIGSDTVTEITVDHPPLRLLRGIYTWGWREHPPRIQFLQPVFEIVNAHTGEVELEPAGRSFAERNRLLGIDDIGAAAPEKKMHTVARAVLDGTASLDDVHSMLTDPDTAPSGTWQDWIDLASDRTQLPPEARDILAAEGIGDGSFGDYDFVAVYLNQEMYGDGPRGATSTAPFGQGDEVRVKVINLDENTHYYRLVDFGPRLDDDLASVGGAASHTFGVFSLKPFYGAPKVAEAQWRAGWGFRPHFDVIQQPDVFSRPEDQVALSPYTDGSGETHTGYQYSADVRGGDFRFNPPPFIIGSPAHPSADRLRESDGSAGLLIGQTTPGYGAAQMCSSSEFPLGTFCGRDISQHHPLGLVNRDTDGDGTPDALWFPPFLRNPNPAGGDIIPPTPAWEPFLYINPNNGTLYIDPADPSAGFWTDLTFAHGAPVGGGEEIVAEIEAPRGAGQVFYQFDSLFHDNAIFSPHVR